MSEIVDFKRFKRKNEQKISGISHYDQQTDWFYHDMEDKLYIAEVAFSEINSGISKAGMNPEDFYLIPESTNELFSAVLPSEEDDPDLVIYGPSFICHTSDDGGTLGVVESRIQNFQDDKMDVCVAISKLRGYHEGKKHWMYYDYNIGAWQRMFGSFYPPKEIAEAADELISLWDNRD